MHKLILMKIPYFKPLIMKNSFFKIENIIEMDVDSEGWDIIVEYLYLKYEKDDIKQSDEDFVMKYREDKVAIALLVLNELGDTKYYKKLGCWLNYNKLDISVLNELHNLQHIKNYILMAVGINYSIVDIYKYPYLYKDIVKKINSTISNKQDENDINNKCYEA